VNSPRSTLLRRIIDDVARHGLLDRSLRDIATAVDSNHRMLLYHFESRAGLISAIVNAVEADQRRFQLEIAARVSTPAELVRELWAGVSAVEMRPFVRLFFECVASGSDELTQSWIEESDAISAALGVRFAPDEIRMGVALVRGLLIDVLTTGEVAPATAALERFIGLFPEWESPSS
jgi:AcrR family transcriptional regulator